MSKCIIKDCNNETEFDVDGWCEEHFRMLFLDNDVDTTKRYDV